MKALLALSALALVTTVASYGSSLQASVTTTGAASVCFSPSPCIFSPGLNETVSSSTGSVMGGGGQSAIDPGGLNAQFGASGSASASFGSASASMFATTGAPETGELCSIGQPGACALGTISGSASFSDDLFVETGLGGGTIQYSVEFETQVGGTLLDDLGDGTASFNGQELSTRRPDQACMGTDISGIDSGNCIFSVPFTDGVAIPISAAVTAEAGGNSGPPFDGFGEGTFSLQSITILNSDGTPISNFDWSSSSGSSYAFVAGTETPEPGGFLLAFSALFMLTGRCFLKSLPPIR